MLGTTVEQKIGAEMCVLSMSQLAIPSRPMRRLSGFCKLGQRPGPISSIMFAASDAHRTKQIWQ